MSIGIPGLDGPVSPSEESFEFTPPPEAADDGTNSKYVFESGKYRAATVSIVKAMTKSEPPKPQFVLTFVGKQGKAAGIDYKKYLPLTGKGAAITERVLKLAYGITKNETGGYAFKPADVVGKDVDLDLKQSEYNGKKRMEVANVFKADAGTTAPAANPGIPF